MFLVSCLSCVIAFTNITGIIGNRSFNFEVEMHPISVSQRAPSMNKPLMYAPSLGGEVNSSFCFLVTSHCRHILSKGHSFLRAVLCMIAVKNDCGLKKPANHTDEGSWNTMHRVESCPVCSHLLTTCLLLLSLQGSAEEQEAGFGLYINKPLTALKDYHGKREHTVRFTDNVTGANPYTTTLHHLFNLIVLYMA